MAADDEDAKAALADAQENDELAAGFANEPTKPDKPEPAAAPEGATVAAEEVPEYVQISAKDWADVRAAAAKTASYDAQLSKAFGTIGNLQKLVNGFQANTPRGGKVEIPKDAFAEMERDFPELAQQTRKAIEAALAGVTSGSAAAEVDTGKIEGMLASYTSKREIEALEDAYPDWRTIVGAVDGTSQQPDPANAFRKWLGTKDATYQARINASESAAVIGRAIRRFQDETKAAASSQQPAVTKPRDDARAERIRSAVQPRGDNAGAAAGKSEDEEFLAGFNSR